MKKWTAVQYDLTKLLSAEVKSDRIKIPPNEKLELIIELEDAAYDRLAKDPTWLQKMHDRANAKVVPVLDVVKKKVREADEKSQKFDAKTADIFSKDINAFISQKMQTAGKEMAAEVDKFFEEYKKGKSELLKFRIKSGGKITLNAITVIGATAVAGASHGAMAPPAIVAIVRASIVISQECVKLGLDADKFAKIIQAELKVLKELMEKGKQKAAKEVALSALSGVLGIETPSLTNLESHIEVHKVDITKLEVKSHELGAKVNEAYDRQIKWDDKLKQNEKSLSPGKVAKLNDKIEKSVKTLKSVIDATVKVNRAVERAQLRQKTFEDALTALKKGVPDWVKYVTPAVTMAVDIGLAIGGAGSVLEGALGTIATAETDIASVLLDKM